MKDVQEEQNDLQCQKQQLSQEEWDKRVFDDSYLWWYGHERRKWVVSVEWWSDKNSWTFDYRIYRCVVTIYIYIYIYIAKINKGKLIAYTILIISVLASKRAAESLFYFLKGTSSTWQCTPYLEFYIWPAHPNEFMEMAELNDVDQTIGLEWKQRVRLRVRHVMYEILCAQYG